MKNWTDEVYDEELEEFKEVNPPSSTSDIYRHAS